MGRSGTTFLACRGVSQKGRAVLARLPELHDRSNPHAEMRGRMMKLTAFSTLLALAVFSACAPSFAAGPDQASTAHQDTEFLKQANQGSVDEIDLAQIALKKSNDPDVKNFAQRIIDDHNKLLNNMKPFDMEAGLTVPEHDDVATDAEKAKLEVLTGKSFDKAYIKEMVEDHHKVVEAFLSEEKKTGYPAFRTAVKEGEQVVREHLEIADKIAKKDGLATAPVPAAGS
jgi:putative membrane protein